MIVEDKIMNNLLFVSQNPETAMKFIAVVMYVIVTVIMSLIALLDKEAKDSLFMKRLYRLNIISGVSILLFLLL